MRQRKLRCGLLGPRGKTCSCQRAYPHDGEKSSSHDPTSHQLRKAIPNCSGGFHRPCLSPAVMLLAGPRAPNILSPAGSKCKMKGAAAATGELGFGMIRPTFCYRNCLRREWNLGWGAVDFAARRGQSRHCPEKREGPTTRGWARRSFAAARDYPSLTTLSAWGPF